MLGEKCAEYALCTKTVLIFITHGKLSDSEPFEGVVTFSSSVLFYKVVYIGIKWNFKNNCFQTINPYFVSG